MQGSTFAQVYGMDLVCVAASCLANATSKRDGKSGVVASVANGSTGVYTFTLAQKFPQLVSATASIHSVDASPTDIVCQVAYNATTGVLTVYTLAVATLTAPEAGSRVCVTAWFSRQDSLKD